MIQLMPTHDPTSKNQAYTALKRLNSDGLFHEPKRHASAASMGEIVLSQAIAQGHDVGTAADVVALAHALLSGRPLEIGVGDWDELFRAVEERLTRTVGIRLAATPEPQVHDTAGRVQVVVLECVSALDQLHTALTHERHRCYQLELEVVEAKIALAQMHAELAGVQAG